MLQGNERFLFSVFRGALDRYRARREKVSRKRSQSGRLGAAAREETGEESGEDRPMPANASKNEQMPANGGKPRQPFNTNTGNCSIAA